jgi:hypothetical protein
MGSLRNIIIPGAQPRPKMRPFNSDISRDGLPNSVPTTQRGPGRERRVALALIPGTVYLIQFRGKFT